jgi:integrase
MKTKHAPYSLYKKTLKDGASIWHVRFWNPAVRRYDKSRSTGILVGGKKGRVQEAHEAALAFLAEASPAAVEGRKFLPFLEWFWDAKSPYFTEFSMNNGREASAKHIRQSAANVRLHIAPFAPFRDLPVSAVKAPLLRDWTLDMLDKGKSPNLIRSCQQVVSTALSYLVTREELEYNPMQKVKAPHVKLREKGILRRKEIGRLTASASGNPEARLAVLLGCLFGMRLGEVRGLCWEDIKKTVIRVRHNWQNETGLKAPKYDSVRTVPLHSAIIPLLDRIGRKESGLVFPGQDGRTPPCVATVNKRFVAELVSVGIGVDEMKRRNLTFHSLRHTFVTLCQVLGISTIETQAFAGHKHATQTAHYTHGAQIADFTASRRKLGTIIGRNG